MTNYLQPNEKLQTLIDGVLSDLGYDKAKFWNGFGELVREFAPRNIALLQKREDLQSKIDAWHKEHAGKPHDADEYEAFLRDIGYIVPQGEEFSISTSNIDEEISTIAGAQLVVPVKNARFAINACNARWGSLYDVLYSSDVLPETPETAIGSSYNPKRGEKVIAWACEWLDKTFPLDSFKYENATSFSTDGGKLTVTDASGKTASLKNAKAFVGYNSKESILLKNNNLHVELLLDEKNPQHIIKDVIMEAAISTIMDAEDSVTAVDAEDKCEVYYNWLKLMQGTLTEEMEKAGKKFTRKMNEDKKFTSPDGKDFTLHGRSLMLVRNVGHLMTNPAIIYDNDKWIPEGIMDAVVTGLMAHYDIKGKNKLRNSRTGSMYIVKPKMHGPEEAAFTNDLFAAVEDLLGYERNTMKVGVMDEERRTSVNLQETIRAVKERLIFINTGFLDRTGDEIHTCMQAGAVIPKAEMKQTAWIAAYEDNNVAVGLRCGLQGKAQIGKGMWAMPDLLGDMLQQKSMHPLAGANCAWVPSPSGATLHAIHYHETSVQARQDELKKTLKSDYIKDLLKFPLAEGRNFDSETIQRELDNNAQSILGYVVRWVEHGVGCSKVPDINDVALMEDRATLRISSQLLANWLLHGICSKEDLLESFKRMAKKVDEQNESDKNYTAMSADYDKSIAFQAACALVFEGTVQPSGYTEPILHSMRLKFKEA